MVASVHTCKLMQQGLGAKAWGGLKGHLHRCNLGLQCAARLLKVIDLLLPIGKLSIAGCDRALQLRCLCHGCR